MDELLTEYQYYLISEKMKSENTAEIPCAKVKTP